MNEMKRSKYNWGWLANFTSDINGEAPDYTFAFLWFYWLGFFCWGIL